VPPVTPGSGAQLLPRAELHVFPGAGHDLGLTHAAEVAMWIDRHLAAESKLGRNAVGTDGP